MLDSVSWHSYWMAIITVSIIYYIVVYALYYRTAIRSVFSGKQFETFSANAALTNADEAIPKSIDGSLEGFKSEVEDHVIYDCMEELNTYFENQKKSMAIKTELMHGLQTILHKYPSLKNSEYKESLSNVIAVQCENICSIHLTADELKGVWMG